MKKLTLTALASSLIIFCSAATAGNGSGVPSAVTANKLSKIFFGTAIRAAKPGCATNNQWALDATTPEGKSMYALVLTAQALGRSVTVTGNNTCSIQPDRETVQFMSMADE